MANFWSIFFLLLFQGVIISRATYDISYGEVCGAIDQKLECESSEKLSKKRVKSKPERIVNGCNVQSTQIPWFAQLLIGQDAIHTVKCGATFINKFWILSAAHCFCNSKLPCKKDTQSGGLVIDYPPEKYHRVLLPTENLHSFRQTTEDTLTTVEIVVHPGYNEEDQTSDFTLARLSYPLVDNAYGIGFYSNYSPVTVMPICLPHSNNFPDTEKHVIVAGRGVKFANCFTNAEGPEVFKPCAKKWVTPGQSVDSVKNVKKMSCSSSNFPSRTSLECRAFRKWLGELGHKPQSALSEGEKALFDMSPGPDEVVLVQDTELKSKQSGFKKINCFSVEASTWCGVCDPDATKGTSGYCEDGETATDITADKGWGFCGTGCSDPGSKFTNTLQIARLFTFNVSTCADMLNKEENKKFGIEASHINTDIELCAGFVRNIRAPVIVFTKSESGEFSFEMSDIDNPDLQTIRMKKNLFESDQLIGGVDSCQGDSGGPLWVEEDVYSNGAKQKKAHLIGVVSRGTNCGNKDLPGIYGRVKTILPWIKEHASTPVKYKKKRVGQATSKVVQLGDERTITPFFETPPDTSEDMAVTKHVKTTKKKKKKKGKKKKKKKTKKTSHSKKKKKKKKCKKKGC